MDWRHCNLQVIIVDYICQIKSRWWLTCRVDSLMTCWARSGHTGCGTRGHRAAVSARHPAQTSSDRWDTPCPGHLWSLYKAGCQWRIVMLVAEVCQQTLQRMRRCSSCRRWRGTWRTEEDHPEQLHQTVEHSHARQNKNSSLNNTVLMINLIWIWTTIVNELVDVLWVWSAEICQSWLLKANDHETSAWQLQLR